MDRDPSVGRSGLSQAGRVHRWLTPFAAFALLTYPPASLTSSLPLPSAAPATAIVGATVIDGTGALPLPDATVVLRGRQIEAVGARGTVRVPADATVIDGRGLFVLPGFVDVNVHIGSTKAAAQALRYGVTTIRDSYGPNVQRKLAVRDSLRAGLVVGARMLAAGIIVGWGPDEIEVDGPDEGMGEDLTRVGADSVRARISRYLDKGVDFVKYGATVHVGNKVLFTDEAQRALVEEVHKRGLVAETHATGLEGLRAAVLAGVDLVQHAEVNDVETDPWPDDLVRQMVERRVICALIPVAVSEALDGLESPVFEQNRQKLIRGGCAIAVSTDGTPGRRTQDAMETLVAEQGMTPMAVLVAATRNGALACKMLDQFGTVTPGKLADLVVLRADPLQDIKNIEQVAVVFTEGRRVDVSP